MRIFFVCKFAGMTLTEFRKKGEAERPHYLLFGHPMEHSWSPIMHNTALQHYGLDGTYYAVDLQNNELSDLAGFLNKDSFLGANVTIPYKQVIADYLDTIDHSAEKIGAINTIVKQDYRLKGYNTDYEGFLSPLEKYREQIEGGGAIIFGTGGATKAIVWALKDLGTEVIYLVSRTPARISSFEEIDQTEVVSYDQWTSFADEVQLVVNATPLGMSPNISKSPVRETETKWLADHLCYDIVYNPLKTKFLRQAEKVGATTIGGLEMLIEQGSRSFELWTGLPFPIEKVKTKLYERLEN